MSVRLFLLLGCIMMFSCSAPEPKAPNAENTVGRIVTPNAIVVLFSATGTEKARLNVALAETETQRNTGLMDVHTMDDKTGMLFLFEREQPLSFWMANTPLALDMLFINAKFEVVTIHRNTQPYTEAQFKSDKPAQYVLEVRGGWTLDYDVNPGDKIEWRRTP